MTTMALTQLPLQESAFVSHLCLDCPSIFKKKLLAMGFVAHTPIKIIRVAPLGCPMEIEIANVRLSLRKSEAGCVFVSQGASPR
jgi:ferrous iron transport protein A